MCVNFRKSGQQWSPSRPCCLPNFWLKAGGTPHTGKQEPCFLQLSKEQRRDFRAFVKSTDSEIDPVGSLAKHGDL
eukprot:4494486-Amphidinium_carterae.1